MTYSPFSPGGVDGSAAASHSALIAGRDSSGNQQDLLVDTTGSPLTTPNNLESTGNTTTATLASGGTYTGTGEQNPLPHVLVYCFSDISGTLYFDWSVDGTNWHAFPTAGYKVAASIPEYQPAVKGGRYFRVRFVMDAGTQTEFRLTTYYGDNFVPSASPLNQPYGLDHASLVVRPTFTWLDIARSLTTGVRFINKFGRNANAAAGEAVWAQSTAQTYPSTAATCDVASDQAADKGTPTASTGARTVTIEGLDANYDEITETVTLDGTNAVTTANTYSVVHRAYVASVGSGGTAAGNITITSNDTGNPVMAYIAVGFNQTQSANYTIPAGHTGYFNLPQVTLQNTTNNSTLHLGLFLKEASTGIEKIRTDFLLQGGAAADYQQKEFGAPIIFQEKDTIFWKVISTAAGGTFNVAVDYDIWLVNEN